MTSDLVRLVTVSATYGAGGAVVAPALAQRLGVPFVQRATNSAGGVGAAGPCVEPLTRDESNLTPASWLLACLTAAMPTGPTQSAPPSRHQDDELRRHCGSDIRALGKAGAGGDPGPGGGDRARQGPRVPRPAGRAAAGAGR